MLHQKHKSYKYVLSLKNWVDWITTNLEKDLTTQKCTFEKKCPKIKKNMTAFYKFALKIEAS